MQFDFSREYYRYRKYFLAVPRLFGQKKARVYTGLILSFFTISFFGLFALRPTFLTIANLLVEIREKEELNQRLNSKINDLVLAQSFFSEKIAPRLSLLDEALPKDDKLNNLLAETELTANQSGISLSSLSFEPVEIGKNEKGIASIDFTTSVIGPYQVIKNFLTNLAAMRRLVEIKGFNLSLREEQEIPDLLLSVQLKSFFQPK